MQEEQIVKKYPLLGSSVDPTKVSLTFKGIAVGLIPVIIIVARGFGFDILESDLVELVENLTTLIAVIMMVWGGIRKLVNIFKK
jgi:hypothetical protein